jgi:F0F1-type ATP synthase assembly protein I
MFAPGMSAGREGESQVWGLISTLVGGPAVWGAIGYGVDRLADTSAFLPIGVVVGFLTSFYIVYVKTKPLEQAEPATDPAAARTDTGDDAPS